MVTLQPKTFNSTPQITARLQPFNAPPPLCRTGPIIGYNIITREPERFNPWELRLRGIIQATIFRLIATLGGGKTALYMMLAFRLLEMAAGLDAEGNPKQMRGRIEENKHEAFDSAFKQFSEITAANLVKMEQYEGLNPFGYSRGMNELDMLARVLRTTQIQNHGRPLSQLGYYAMQVGTHLMFKHPEMASPAHLYDILRNADMSDEKQYADFLRSSYLQSNAKLFEENEKLREEVLQRHSRETSNLTPEEFRAGCREAMLFPNQLLGGDYGNSFGDKLGVSELTTDPLSVLDWLNVPDTARAIITSLMWQEQTVATRDRALADRIPNFVLMDEAGKAAANESLLEYQAAAAKDARAYPTLVMQATQFEAEDLILVGEKESRARALASASNRAVGGRFVGPLGQLNDSVIAYTEGLGIEYHEAFFMSGMPPGCFVLLIPNQPLRYIQVVPRPIEWAMIGSDSAAEETMAAVDQHIWTVDEILANAERVNSASPSQEERN